MTFLKATKSFVILGFLCAGCTVSPEPLVVASPAPAGQTPYPSGPLSAEELERGRIIVGTWNGLGDEIPPHIPLVLKQPNVNTSPSALPSVIPSANPPTPNPNPTSNPSNPNQTEFRIPLGTGSNPWNTQQNPALLIVGKRFVIFNDDTEPHQWHTNGEPCPHGNLIPPGGQYACTPSTTFEGRLYDHLHQQTGFFYVKAVRQ